MKLIVWTLLFCAIKAVTTERPSDYPVTSKPELLESNAGPESQDLSSDGPTNTRHFKYFSNRVPWGEAQAACLKLGGHLATIHSEDEDRQVRELTTGQEAWIGFSDCQLEGTWFWMDSNPANYSNWCTGEPNNGGYGHFVAGFENCAVTDGQCWKDTSCTNSRSYVCEVTAP